MILTEAQIKKLSLKTKDKLLDALYLIEDELNYKSKKVSKTIDYLQQERDKDLCWECYNDIYLETFYDNHEQDQQPVCFSEFYNNEWQDEDCKEWFLSIYKIQNKGE